MASGDGGEGIDSGFQVAVSGHVESAQFLGCDNLYCKYAYHFGTDWRMVEGPDPCISQIARKGTDGDNLVVWNFPLAHTFESTNVFGWPRLVLSVYGIDSLGRDLVRGYGAVLVPTAPGRYTRYVRMFAPVSSSYLKEFVAWLTGNPSEFVDAKVVAKGEGREVTRVKSTGVVKVQFEVATRGMAKFGYVTGADAAAVSSSS